MGKTKKQGLILSIIPIILLASLCPFSKCSAESDNIRDKYTEYCAVYAELTGDESHYDSIEAYLNGRLYKDSGIPFCHEWKDYVTPVHQKTQLSIGEFEIHDLLLDRCQGIIDFNITVDERYVRPMICLDQYSPFYDPIEVWGAQYCFEEVFVFCGDSICVDGGFDEVADDKHEMHIVRDFLLPGRVYTGELRICFRLCYLNDNGEVVEEKKEILLQAEPSCTLERKEYSDIIFANEDFEISNLEMTVTQLSSNIEKDESRFTRAGYEYYVLLFTPSGKIIKRFGGGDDYIDAIPEYVVVQVWKEDQLIAAKKVFWK